jgi:hypothetical protein
MRNRKLNEKQGQDMYCMKAFNKIHRDILIRSSNRIMLQIMDGYLRAAM